MKAIDFTDYPNERCFINRSEDTMIYLKHSTGFIAVALIDNEGTYKIELLDGAYDTPTLKHFVALFGKDIEVEYKNNKGETETFSCKAS